MAIRLLRAAINWAIAEGLAKSNPCSHVKLGSDGTRDDYRRLFEALDRLRAQRRIRPAAADAIRALALTGARKGEIAALRWQHIDPKTVAAES